MSNTNRQACQPNQPYIGRFAPSPTGPLHMGSLVAAMASWLDARAQHGRWLVRVEDLDPPREVAGANTEILATLIDFGFEWQPPVMFQSKRSALYQNAFERLQESGWIFPCACTRKEIADSSMSSDHGNVYPGRCRAGLATGRNPRAWRMRIEHPANLSDSDLSDADASVFFQDRNFGVQHQNLKTEVGDFVLKRADGLWAYQLAVVVDDAAQGITHVVRGADLLDSTPRQIHLQRALGYTQPSYLHVPVVVNTQGEKLGKQTGALALNRQHPIAELRLAMRHLGLPIPAAHTIQEFWEEATIAWGQRWPMAEQSQPANDEKPTRTDLSQQ